MRFYTVLSIAFFLSLGFSPSLLFAQPLSHYFTFDSIYGIDNRIEVRHSPNALIEQASESVAVIATTSDLKKTANHQWLLNTQTYGVLFGLCPDERFWNQPSSALSTASLIGKRVALTAAHAIDEESCHETRIAFNYIINETNIPKVQFRDDEVYDCKKILYSNEKEDIAIFELDRDVEGRLPLPMNLVDDLTPGSSIVAIGTPDGLPLKAATGNVIKKTLNQLILDTDTFSGNSGSPIINMTTGKIEGVLTEGGTDFVYDPVRKCRRAMVYPSVSCLLGRCREAERATRLHPLRKVFDNAL